GVLLQRLADPGDVAVAEDSEHAGDERTLHAVPLGALHREEAHQGLGQGEALGATRARHGVATAGAATRGSGSCRAQVPRIQAYAGSSVKPRERVVAGP